MARKNAPTCNLYVLYGSEDAISYVEICFTKKDTPNLNCPTFGAQLKAALFSCSFTIDVRPQVQKKAIESIRMVFTTKSTNERTFNCYEQYNTFPTISPPHTIETRFYAVKLYRSGCSVRFVCRRYHISKASLMRWNKKFDGARQSLADGAHRPLSSSQCTYID